MHIFRSPACLAATCIFTSHLHKVNHFNFCRHSPLLPRTNLPLTSHRDFIGNARSCPFMDAKSLLLCCQLWSALSLCSQVGNSLSNMRVGLKEHLERLEEIFSPRGDYTQSLRFLQQMANNIIKQLTAMPDTSKVQVDLAAISDQTAFIEYYRWALRFSNYLAGTWKVWQRHFLSLQRLKSGMHLVLVEAGLKMCVV